MAVGAEAHLQASTRLCRHRHRASGTEDLGHILAADRRSQQRRCGRLHVEHKTGCGSGAVLAGRVCGGADVDGGTAKRSEIGGVEGQRHGVAIAGETLAHAVSVAAENNTHRSTRLGGDGHGAAGSAGFFGILIIRRCRQDRRGHRTAQNKAGAGRWTEVAGSIAGAGADAHAALPEDREIGAAEQHRLPNANTAGTEALVNRVPIGREMQHYRGAGLRRNNDGAAAGNAGVFNSGSGHQRRHGRRDGVHRQGTAANQTEIGIEQRQAGRIHHAAATEQQIGAGTAEIGRAQNAAVAARCNVIERQCGGARTTLINRIAELVANADLDAGQTADVDRPAQCQFEPQRIAQGCVTAALDMALPVQNLRAQPGHKRIAAKVMRALQSAHRTDQVGIGGHHQIEVTLCAAHDDLRRRLAGRTGAVAGTGACHGHAIGNLGDHRAQTGTGAGLVTRQGRQHHAILLRISGRAGELGVIHSDHRRGGRIEARTKVERTNRLVDACQQRRIRRLILRADHLANRKLGQRRDENGGAGVGLDAGRRPHRRRAQ